MTTEARPVSGVSIGAGQVVGTTAAQGYPRTMLNTEWRLELAPNQHDGSRLPSASGVPGGPRDPYYWQPAGSSALDGWVPTLWYENRPIGRPMGVWRMAGPAAAPGEPAPLEVGVVPGPR